MDDENHNLDSLKRVVQRLRELSGDGFAENMVEILERELARHESAGEPSRQGGVAQSRDQGWPAAGANK